MNPQPHNIMNSQFILPAATAVAFHVVVFFGLNGRPPSAGDIAVKAPPSDPPPTIVVNVDELETPEPDPYTDPEVRSQKGIDVSPPVAHEPPARPVRSEDLVIEVPPVNSHVRVVSTLIPPGVPGDPSGDDTGTAVRPGGVFGLDKLDGVPQARVQIGPIYPAEARLRGLEGEVLVAFTVDEEGRVLNPHVMRSTDSIFDEAARRAVAKWRFEPGRRQGRIVRFSMAVPMRFSINE